MRRAGSTLVTSHAGAGVVAARCRYPSDSGPGWRATHRGKQLREGVALVRYRHRIHEILLEFRLYRGFDLLDVANGRLDLGAGSRCSADAMAAPVPAALPADSHGAEVAIRNQAEDHRVLRVDMAAEGAREPDPVDCCHDRRGRAAASRPHTGRLSRAGSAARRSALRRSAAVPSYST